MPAIAGMLELLVAGADVVAGGTRRNREQAETFTTFAGTVGEAQRWLLCDAMTSGGLLAAVPGPMEGARIGRLVDGPAGAITVG